MIFTILMVITIVVCVLLAIFILAQNPKGGGLSSAFGGTSSASFGIQRTNDFMEKATWTLGMIAVGLIFLSVVLTAKPSAVVMPSVEQPVKNTPAPVQSENTSSSVNK